jgi:hypothetical protein
MNRIKTYTIFVILVGRIKNVHYYLLLIILAFKYFVYYVADVVFPDKILRLI